MTSKEMILNTIRAKTPQKAIDLPDTNIKHMSYEDKDEKFTQMLKSVGGNALWLKDEGVEDINAFVAKHYSDIKVITSCVDGVTCSTKDANKVSDPHGLNDVELAIIKGEFAVAENGSVYVKNAQNRHRALYFLAQQLLIVVPKDSIVDTMHEAYEDIKFDESGYGLFISGPSKTADIEQALVIGAHGPTAACVLFV